jgi:hypothetical protein
MVLVYVLSLILVEYPVSYGEICYLVKKKLAVGCVLDQTPESCLIQF